MRLTLRTMLAYMQDLLDPSETQEVGRMIEESEFATNLVHRVRDVVRRMRLPAPKLEGRGMGLDPNTVAEYLDNTMAGERVPDFEKVCLESDVHLAEVASCHQVLALVLGEPAEVDQRSRRRMYGLVGQAGPEPRPAETPQTAMAPHRVKPRRRRKPAKVPDYLRESEAPAAAPRPASLVAIVGLLLLVGLTGIFLALEPRGWWQKMIGTGAPLPADERLAQARKDATDKPNGEQSAADKSAADIVKSTAADGQSQDKEPTAAATDTAAEDAKDRDGTDAASAADGEQHVGDEQDAMEGSNANDVESQDASIPVDEPNKTHTAPGDHEPRPVADGETKNAQSKADSSPGKVAGEGSQTSKATPTNGGSKAAEPAEAIVLGRLVSDGNVLLRQVQGRDEWEALERQETVHAGDRLVVLPMFRPLVTLAAGVNLQPHENAGFRVESEDDTAAGPQTTLHIEQGRIHLIYAANQAVVTVRVQDGPAVKLTGDDAATVAIEVQRKLAPGADPEKDRPRVEVDLYVVSGRVEVQGIGGAVGTDTLEAPVHRSLTADALPPADEPGQPVEFPRWVTAEPELSPMDRRAAESIASRLRDDGRVSLVLRELAGDSRVEVSSAAVQCLARINEFDPCIPLLEDRRQRARWAAQIESLKTALARGPETAAAVRQAFEKLRGMEGPALYRMLWGYSDEQLASGDDRVLVGYLDHEDQEYRVLAFWNLQKITGLGLNYQPEASEVVRRPALTKWKQRRDKGEIRHRPAVPPAATVPRNNAPA